MKKTKGEEEGEVKEAAEEMQTVYRWALELVTGEDVDTCVSYRELPACCVKVFCSRWIERSGVQQVPPDGSGIGASVVRFVWTDAVVDAATVVELFWCLLSANPHPNAHEIGMWLGHNVMCAAEASVAEERFRYAPQWIIEQFEMLDFAQMKLLRDLCEHVGWWGGAELARQAMFSLAFGIDRELPDASRLLLLQPPTAFGDVQAQRYQWYSMAGYLDLNTYWNTLLQSYVAVGKKVTEVANWSEHLRHAGPMTFTLFPNALGYVPRQLDCLTLPAEVYDANAYHIARRFRQTRQVVLDGSIQVATADVTQEARTSGEGAKSVFGAFAQALQTLVIRNVGVVEATRIITAYQQTFPASERPQSVFLRLRLEQNQLTQEYMNGAEMEHLAKAICRAFGQGRTYHIDVYQAVPEVIPTKETQEKKEEARRIKDSAMAKHYVKSENERVRRYRCLSDKFIKHVKARMGEHAVVKRQNAVRLFFESKEERKRVIRALEGDAKQHGRHVLKQSVYLPSDDNGGGLLDLLPQRSDEEKLGAPGATHKFCSAFFSIVVDLAVPPASVSAPQQARCMLVDALVPKLAPSFASCVSFRCVLNNDPVADYAWQVREVWQKKVGKTGKMGNTLLNGHSVTNLKLVEKSGALNAAVAARSLSDQDKMFVHGLLAVSEIPYARFEGLRGGASSGELYVYNGERHSIVECCFKWLSYDTILAILPAFDGFPLHQELTRSILTHRVSVLGPVLPRVVHYGLHDNIAPSFHAAPCNPLLHLFRRPLDADIEKSDPFWRRVCSVLANNRIRVEDTDLLHSLVVFGCANMTAEGVIFVTKIMLDEDVLATTDTPLRNGCLPLTLALLYHTTDVCAPLFDPSTSPLMANFLFDRANNNPLQYALVLAPKQGNPTGDGILDKIFDAASTFRSEFATLLSEQHYPLPYGSTYEALWRQRGLGDDTTQQLIARLNALPGTDEAALTTCHCVYPTPTVCVPGVAKPYIACWRHLHGTVMLPSYFDQDGNIAMLSIGTGNTQQVAVQVCGPQADSFSLDDLVADILCVDPVDGSVYSIGKNTADGQYYLVNNGLPGYAPGRRYSFTPSELFDADGNQIIWGNRPYLPFSGYYLRNGDAPMVTSHADATGADAWWQDVLRQANADTVAYERRYPHRFVVDDPDPKEYQFHVGRWPDDKTKAALRFNAQKNPGVVFQLGGAIDRTRDAMVASSSTANLTKGVMQELGLPEDQIRQIHRVQNRAAALYRGGFRPDRIGGYTYTFGRSLVHQAEGNVILPFYMFDVTHRPTIPLHLVQMAYKFQTNSV